MGNISDRVIKQISSELSISKLQISNTVNLIQAGNTVPFISRYRKEVTGSLDEVKVYDIQKLFKYYSELEERKAEIIKSIDEQGKLTDELKEKIESCLTKVELEDLYLPYKPKRRTKATIAIEAGLEPLAQLMLDRQDITTGSVEDYAIQYLNSDKDINTTLEATRGAEHIISSWMTENADMRQMARRITFRMGTLTAKVKAEYVDKRTKYEMYYSHTEAVKAVPPHRVLAINRAEREGIISVSIETLNDYILEMMRRRYISNPETIFLPHLESALNDSFKNHIFPSIERDIRNEITEIADRASILVFTENLRNLLLQSPAGEKSIAGIDPGFRTGSKIAVIDRTGKNVATAVIYPIEPMNKVDESDIILKGLFEKIGFEIIAIGNGTASREMDDYIKEMLIRNNLNIPSIVANESGASVYSASEIAREELPSLDVSIRGAVSIARRIQDPLAELVKIDPKSIGVGQYQHDVDQKMLSDSLDNIVESVVNHVGVDLNTASYSLLKYVAGIGLTLAQRIVAYRDEHGKFNELAELLDISGFGDKTYEQSAGFLRIRNGKNPLDNSAIHPEAYEFVYNLCEKKVATVNEIIGNDKLINTFIAKELVTDKFGLPTVQDILKELRKPGRDPRKEYKDVEFVPGVTDIEHLHEGMIVNGVITNVTDFGVFVNVGVHQDGLVHVSEIANKYVKDPAHACRVGDQVQAKVISVDLVRKRIGLSMKQVYEKN
jgi:uncharacterized protein